MTVVVGVAAPDGIILAAESRTTNMFENGRHRIISDTAQKLFPVGRIGVATYGNAFIGGRTIAGLMDEFVSQLGEDAPDTVDALAEALAVFFDGRFRAVADPDLLEWCEANPGIYPVGFLVAGYDEDGIGSIREAGIPGPFVGDAEITTAELGVSWRGQTDVIRRLIKGFDSDEFRVQGHEVPDEMHEPLAGLEYALQLPVTMQDAVDLACFLVRTTIDMQRFSDGTFGRIGNVPGCGGLVRVLSIARAGPEWVTVPALTGEAAAGVAEGGAPAR